MTRLLGRGTDGRHPSAAKKDVVDGAALADGQAGWFFRALSSSFNAVWRN